jgi:AcrR family transcriptional regulator
MKNTKRSELTQNRIKNAAVQLFAEQGYNVAGVAEICAVAEVSKGAFYHHFTSKNALFVSLLDDWLDGLDQQLAFISKGQAPFPEKLIRMGEMITRISNEYQTRIPILFEFWMQASRDEEIWKAAIAPFQRYQDFFAGMIQQGIDEGHLAPVDPMAGAQTLISLAIGLLMQYMLQTRLGKVFALDRMDLKKKEMQNLDWESLIQESIQMLLNGLKRYS